MGYDPANQLCWQSPSGATGTSCSSHPSDASVYTYDNNGNRTAVAPHEGPGSAFGYDQANRLISATVPNTTVADSGQYSSVAPSNIYSGSAVSGTATVTVAGTGGIPTSGVSAVALTIYASGSSAAGTVTAYRSDGTAPSTPNLTYPSGQGMSNLVITKLGNDGKVKIAVSGGSPNVSVIAEGWYATPSGAAGR